MMRSLFAGVSGLKTHQTRMDVIGNNIANVNTVGYKGSRVTFQDVLSQTIRNAAAPSTGGNIGGINAQQVGLGVSLGTIDVNHSQGNIQMTGIATDLALEGDGYFVVTDGAKQYYTRAGAFGLDKQGNLVNRTNGMYVAGWLADGDGKIDSSRPTEMLRVPLGLTSPPKATEAVTFGGNLDADSNGVLSLSSAEFSVDDVTFSVSLKPTGAFNEYEMVISTDTSGSFDNDDTTFTTTVTVTHDGDENAWVLGPKGPDTGPATFTTADGRTFEISLNANNPIGDPLFTVKFKDATSNYQPADVSTTAIYKPARVQQTTEVYDSLGKAHTITTTFEKRSDQEWVWWTTAPQELAGGSTEGRGSLLFKETGREPECRVDSTLTFEPEGANKLTVNFDFSDVTKYSDETSLFLLNQDGYPSGELEGFSIDSNGVLTGEFSNGLTRALGQIAVASFANPEGLLRAGENLFAVSNNSGTANIGVAGAGGRGSITPGAVEMSNVDLSQEFTEMIITQRGFQANSRIITASDEMLQELVNLRR